MVPKIYFSNVNDVLVAKSKGYTLFCDKKKKN